MSRKGKNRTTLAKKKYTNVNTTHNDDRSGDIHTLNSKSNDENNEKIIEAPKNDLVSEMKDAKEVLDALNSHRLSNEIDKLIMYLMDQNYKLNKKYTKISNDYSNLLSDFRNYKKVSRNTASYINELENSDFDKKSLIESVKAFAVSKEQEVSEKNRQIQSQYEIISTINEHNPNINGTSIHEIVRMNEIKDKSIDYLTSVNNELSGKNEILNDKYIKLLEKYNSTLINYKYRSYQVNMVKEWTTQIKDDLITGNLTSMSLLSQINENLTNIVDNYEIYSNEYGFKMDNDENIQAIRDNVKEISELILEHTKNRFDNEKIRPINPHKDELKEEVKDEDIVLELEDEPEKEEVKEDIKEGEEEEIKEEKLKKETKEEETGKDDDIVLELEDISSKEVLNKDEVVEPSKEPESTFKKDTQLDELFDELNSIYEGYQKIDESNKELLEGLNSGIDDYKIYLEAYGNGIEQFKILKGRLEEVLENVTNLMMDSDYYGNNKNKFDIINEKNDNIQELVHSIKLSGEDVGDKIYQIINSKIDSKKNSYDKELDEIIGKLEYIYEELQKIEEYNKELLENLNNDSGNYKIYLESYENTTKHLKTLDNKTKEVLEDIDNLTIDSGTPKDKLDTIMGRMKDIRELSYSIKSIGEEIADKINEILPHKPDFEENNSGDDVDEFINNLINIHEGLQEIDTSNRELLENLNKDSSNYEIYLESYENNIKKFEILEDLEEAAITCVLNLILKPDVLRGRSEIIMNIVKYMEESLLSAGSSKKALENKINEIKNSKLNSEENNPSEELDEFMEELLEFKDIENKNELNTTKESKIDEIPFIEIENGSDSGELGFELEPIKAKNPSIEENDIIEGENYIIEEDSDVIADEDYVPIDEDTIDESNFREISKSELEEMLNTAFSDKKPDESEIQEENSESTNADISEKVKEQATNTDKNTEDITKEVEELEDFVTNSTIDKEYLKKMVESSLDGDKDSQPHPKEFKSELSNVEPKQGENILDIEVSNVQEEIKELDINDLLLDESDVNTLQSTSKNYKDEKEGLESKSIIGANVKSSDRSTINSLLVDENTENQELSVLSDDFEDVEVEEITDADTTSELLDDKKENDEIELTNEELEILNDSVEKETKSDNIDTEGKAVENDEIELTNEELEILNDSVEEETKPKDYNIDLSTIKIEEDNKENSEEEVTDEISEEYVDDVLENFSLDDVDMSDLEI